MTLQEIENYKVIVSDWIPTDSFINKPQISGAGVKMSCLLAKALQPISEPTTRYYPKGPFIHHK